MQEKAARLYLGEQELKDAASYWPRIREKDLDAMVVAKPARGGLVDDVRTTLGAFEKSRQYPTLQVAMRAEPKIRYIDPRRAFLIRTNAGHNMIETAGMLQDMERAGVISRGTNAFGKDGVELFKMPTGGSWWARGPAEARAIRDELTSVQHSSLANVSHWLNTYVRNPSLFNPAVHEVKNMAYKFFLSGGNPRKLVQYENEFRAAQQKFPYNAPGLKQTAQKVGVSPETRQLVDQFLEVMPESRASTSARDTALSPTRMNTRRKVSKPRPIGEYDVRLAEMLAAMQSHITADAKAFEQLIGEVKEVNADLKTVNADVKKLIETRSFAFGAWKAATIIGGIIVVIATLYIAYFKH